jgi:hypothetical protein
LVVCPPAGHPAAGVAWLAAQLGARVLPLEPGDLVITGGLTAAVPLAPGGRSAATFSWAGADQVTVDVTRWYALPGFLVGGVVVEAVRHVVIEVPGEPAAAVEPWWCAAEPADEPRRRHRGCVPESLRVHRSQAHQVVDLLIGLDPFRDDVQAETSREVDHPLDEPGSGASPGKPT